MLDILEQPFAPDEVSGETLIAAISEAVHLIGTPDFAEGLMRAVSSLVEVDGCELLLLHGGRVQVVDRAGDPMAAVSGVTPSAFDLRTMLRPVAGGDCAVSISGIDAPQGNDPQKHQRITLCCIHDHSVTALRLLRSPDREPLSQRRLDHIRRLARIFLSFVTRHLAIAVRRSQAAAPLVSLQMIEESVLRTNELTRRESQVCARILHGLTTLGIALDLDIGKESVVTYRKRAYSRLAISSQRELLVWYLDAYDKQLLNLAA
ncbi:helix-turn-helix transcriptional regulator [Seohaeicola zhoushanensis]|uniref:Helix-turn-helix transcriptional regulator n=1 Tax=Seohaeicola zhoushanensis TaxID=1569283 RepID=A0A8J3M8V3_9RHOB|nr:LuxR C-terminal-related transcriptional regulator [Seohaeicola zhoushanensis]GHF61970.1 helix-turn-helix transcriptional regulator [Seohaeicola zhoushanensis]